MKNTLRALALFATGAVLAGACTEEYRTASPTMEPRQSAKAAAESIADAECDREQRCGNIGQGRSFLTSNHCLQAKFEPISHELSDPDCGRNGVGNTDLYQCLEQIQGRNCGNVMTAGFWEEMMACGSGDLCLE